MALVLAGLAELADGELEALAEEPALVERARSVSDRLAGPGDQRQVAEADAAFVKGRRGEGQLREPLADRDPIGGRPTTEVAVDANPVDRAEEAAVVPLTRFREAAGELGELDLHQVDDMPQLDQLLADLRARELDRRPRAIALDRQQQLG